MGLSISIGRDYENIPEWHWILEFALSVCGIAINSACLWYVVRKLKINVYIKNILLLSLGTLLACEFSGLISVILMYALACKNLLLCALFILPKWVIGLAASHAAMSIAVVRYYLAETTARVEAINHTLIKTFISIVCLAILGEVSGLVYLTITYDNDNDIDPLMAACSNRNFDGPEIPSLIIAGTILIAYIIGIAFDLSLSRFIQRRNNRTQPTMEMAVWSSGVVPAIALPKSQKIEEQLSIPLKATIIGNLYFLGISIAMAFWTGETSSQMSLTGAVLSLIVRVFIELYMSFLIVFAIKSNEKKTATTHHSNRVIQPPQGLQFHD